MPRILTRKNIAVAFAVVLIAFFCLLGYFIIAALLACSLWLNSEVIRRINLPTARIGARRDIETVDTLVVGDMCSKQVLKRYCTSANSLVIMAPGRSLSSSALIIAHLESVLQEGGTVIMIGTKRDNVNKVTAFDLPFISRVSLLELGIKKSFALCNMPFYLYPFKSIRMIIGSHGTKSEADCPSENIKKMCERKNLKLIYLE